MTAIGSPAAPADDAILTVQQVSEWTQLSVRQVQRAGIPFINFGTRSRRYRAVDVKRWMEAHLSPTRAARGA